MTISDQGHGVMHEQPRHDEHTQPTGHDGSTTGLTCPGPTRPRHAQPPRTRRDPTDNSDTSPQPPYRDGLKVPDAGRSPNSEPEKRPQDQEPRRWPLTTRRPRRRPAQHRLPTSTSHNAFPTRTSMPRLPSHSSLATHAHKEARQEGHMKGFV